jgi:hypothetical protein
LSTIRKISESYRLARAKKREAAAIELRARQQVAFEAAIKAGTIKPPKFIERDGRMVYPRERLVALYKAKWERATGLALEVAVPATILRAHGHRSGYGQQYEVVRIPRKPDRNKYVPLPNKTWEGAHDDIPRAA